MSTGHWFQGWYNKLSETKKLPAAWQHVRPIGTSLHFHMVLVQGFFRVHLGLSLGSSWVFSRFSDEKSVEHGDRSSADSPQRVINHFPHEAT